MSIIINGSTTLAGPTLIGPVQPLLLDTYTGAAAAYSLRKLRTAYTGSAIRVRRSPDNAQSDIGFDVSGNLDENALTTFVGAGDGFITTWYDQSGNNRGAIQSTQSLQPRIVNAGTIDKKNSKPVLIWSGTSMKLTINSSTTLNFTLTSPLSYFVSAYGTKVNSGPRLIGKSGSQQFFTSATSGYQTLAMNSTILIGNIDVLDNNYYINTALMTGSSWTMYANGTQSATTTNLSGIGTANLASMIIGDDQTNPRAWNGGISEIIIYNSDQSSNRMGIELNINYYYNIY